MIKLTANVNVDYAKAKLSLVAKTVSERDLKKKKKQCFLFLDIFKTDMTVTVYTQRVSKLLDDK